MRLSHPGGNIIYPSISITDLQLQTTITPSAENLNLNLKSSHNSSPNPINFAKMPFGWGKYQPLRPFISQILELLSPSASASPDYVHTSIS